MNNKLPIIIVISLLLAGVGFGAYFVFSDSTPSISLDGSSDGDDKTSLWSANGRDGKLASAPPRDSRSGKSNDSGTSDKTQNGNDPTSNGGSSAKTTSRNPDEVGADLKNPKVNPDGTFDGAVGGTTPTPVKVAPAPPSQEELNHKRLAELAGMKIAESKTGESNLREAPLGIASEEVVEGVQMARQSSSGRGRRTGSTHPQMEESYRSTSKRVKGMVFEVRSGVRYPLADVLVTDMGDRHKTYSDANGRFEFDAFYNDHMKENSEERRDGDPSNDRVYLLARADGYRMSSQLDSETRQPGRMFFTGAHYMPEDYNTKDGALLELIWHGSDTVRTKLKNAPSNPSLITIKIESYGGASARDDDSIFLSAPADKNGEAVFNFPPRRNLEITAVGSGYTTKGSATYLQDKGYYEIEIQSVSNSWVSGRVIDYRDGNPVANARVYGYVTEREAIYTDASGNFAGWLPNSQGEEASRLNILVSHPDYAEVRDDIMGLTASNVRMTSGASAPEGPWEIRMRPIVRIRGSVNVDNGHIASENLTATFAEGHMRYYMTIKNVGNSNQIVEAYMPWGMDEISFQDMATDENGVFRKLKFFIKLSESFWTEADEYDAQFQATMNG